MHDLIVVVACLGVVLIPAAVLAFRGEEAQEE